MRDDTSATRPSWAASNNFSSTVGFMAHKRMNLVKEESRSKFFFLFFLLSFLFFPSFFLFFQEICLPSPEQDVVQPRATHLHQKEHPQRTPPNTCSTTNPQKNCALLDISSSSEAIKRDHFQVNSKQKIFLCLSLSPFRHPLTLTFPFSLTFASTPWSFSPTVRDTPPSRLAILVLQTSSSRSPSTNPWPLVLPTGSRASCHHALTPPEKLHITLLVFRAKTEEAVLQALEVVYDVSRNIKSSEITLRGISKFRPHGKVAKITVNLPQIRAGVLS